MESANEKPLFTLSAGEFAELVGSIVERVIERISKNSGMAANEAEETFNVRQLSAFLKCSRMSIYNYLKRGLPFYKVGRKMLFKKTEVLRFMKSIKG